MFGWAKKKGVLGGKRPNNDPDSNNGVFKQPRMANGSNHSPSTASTTPTDRALLKEQRKQLPIHSARKK